MRTRRFVWVSTHLLFTAVFPWAMFGPLVHSYRAQLAFSEVSLVVAAFTRLEGRMRIRIYGLCVVHVLMDTNMSTSTSVSTRVC